MKKDIVNLAYGLFSFTLKDLMEECSIHLEKTPSRCYLEELLEDLVNNNSLIYTQATNHYTIRLCGGCK